MTAQYQQKIFIQTTTAILSPEQRLAHVREQDWQNRVRNLQDCICELLVKNQQLRESLALITQQQNKETPHE